MPSGDGGVREQDFGAWNVGARSRRIRKADERDVSPVSHNVGTGGLNACSQGNSLRGLLCYGFGPRAQMSRLATLHRCLFTVMRSIAGAFELYRRNSHFVYQSLTSALVCHGLALC